MSAPDRSASGAPPRIAVYRRRVPAPLERVWENVRDWEHLPWLHAESFRTLDCHEGGDWGWRARIGLQPAGEIELELLIEGSRYVARTLEGPGQGTEIWTALEPAEGDSTDVEVAFHVPDATDRDPVGAAFVQLYERLWDQDEAMIRTRASELARLRERRREPEEPLELGPVAELRGRLPLSIDWGADRFRVLEVDGEILVHGAICPHWRGPLDAAPVRDGCVRCPWHGYRFDVRSGRSADGRRLRLATPPRLEIDAAGTARLIPARRRPTDGSRQGPGL